MYFLWGGCNGGDMYCLGWIDLDTTTDFYNSKLMLLSSSLGDDIDLLLLRNSLCNVNLFINCIDLLPTSRVITLIKDLLKQGIVINTIVNRYLDYIFLV